MQFISTSVGPLSPFLWDAPHAELVPPGFTPGTVADAMLHISDLTLRFDVLSKSIHNSFHSVRTAVEHHPIHTRMLHKRQFDVIRYGMVLDEVERLVIFPVPRMCGDSGVKVSQEYAAIFHDDFNRTPCASHPILPEYCFIVYQLPKSNNNNDKESQENNGRNEGEDVNYPIPLFRLVFRNEAFNEQVKMHLVEKFPLFRLRSVYVSHKKYYHIQRQIDLYNEASKSSEKLPDYELEKTLGLSKLRWLFDAWLMVLEGIAPSWVIDKGVGPDIVTLFLASHRPEGKYDVKEYLEAYSILPIDNRIRCSYYATGERMRKRINIMARYPEMINKWRQGAYNIRYFSEEVIDAEPKVQVAQCIRMLLCRRKPGRNYIEDDEIAAFIPIDEECKPLRVYNTLAAERLRLWVLKGLLTAELHGVHCLMIEFDTAMVVAECVGLLWGGGEEDRQREVVFHVCKIIMETVEDYVQHSGVIWSVTIVTSDEDALRSAHLCQEILEVTQMAKTRVEIEERQRVAKSIPFSCHDEETPTPSDAGVTAQEEEEEYDNNEDEDDDKEINNKNINAPPASEGFKVNANKQEVSKRDLVRYPRTGGILSTTSNTSKTLVTLAAITATANTSQLGNTPFEEVAKFSESIRERAARCGVRISDGELYPIFLALAQGGELVMIEDIVHLILEKQSEMKEGKGKGTTTRLLWPHDHPICALDSCGVPCDANTVRNFVKSFQRRPYREQSGYYNKTQLIKSASSAAGVENDNVPESLNYVEFSMLMLALARQ